MDLDFFWALWIAAIAAAIVSVLLACFLPKRSAYKWIHLVIIALWTLGPPTWFLLDAARRAQPNGKAPTEKEKYFYDSAGKFWAGVLAMLLAVYTRDKWVEKLPESQAPSPAAVAPGNSPAGGIQ
jgi:hypothetical protein